MKHILGAPLYGRLLASPTNIRLGWKGLSETNTLAYYENPEITAVKCFIVQAPGPHSKSRQWQTLQPEMINYGHKKFIKMF